MTEGRPLELSYNWQAPVGIASVAAVVCIGLLIRSGARGWPTVAAIVVALWAAFLLVVWSRTRAFIQVDGPILTVRRYRHKHQLDGRRLSSIREYLTGNGPCYKVQLQGERGQYFIPAALLRSGHSTFFDWALANSPDVGLDKRSRRTVEQLRTRGLIE